MSPDLIVMTDFTLKWIFLGMVCSLHHPGIMHNSMQSSLHSSTPNPSVCVAGGIASFQRPDADLQYLSLVAGSALEKEPASLLLLVSPTDAQTASKGQTGVFLLAGPSGNVPSSVPSSSVESVIAVVP